MATETVDLQRLLVSLEASFVKYERAWNKAQGITDANTKRLRTKFDGVDKSLSRMGSDTRGLNNVKLQTANISAQFQDIAVQLQSGQSPFTIALQQGTQLSAALGSQAGLKGTVAALGAGFASMVNPVSLATIAIIGLGGAAVQWLTQTKNEVEDTNKTVDEHIKRIKEIARGYNPAGDVDGAGAHLSEPASPVPHH